MPELLRIVSMQFRYPSRSLHMVDSLIVITEIRMEWNGKSKIEVSLYHIFLKMVFFNDALVLMVCVGGVCVCVLLYMYAYICIIA